MPPASPAEALGSHVRDVRVHVVEAVCSTHTRFAEAHQVSGSRYAMAFGSQWRDLLDDVEQALHGRGYQSHKLLPAGYKLPVVNGCLVYVWRVPDSADQASSFASSSTRVNGFFAPRPDPMLFEPGLSGDVEQAHRTGSQEEAELERVVRVVRAADDADDADDLMPLVLVMVRSSPRQLQSIEWAVAELDEAAGGVKLHGQTSIWAPEPGSGGAAADVESFDSGPPKGPTIEPQEQEGNQPDA